VTLDGSQSTDANNDQLTYKWTAPSGITLSSTTIAKPTFTAPEVSQDTQFTFGLVVNDGLVNSDPVTVKVTVRNVIAGISNPDPFVYRVFPNPSTGIFTIETAERTGIKTVITVCNSVGTEVYRKEIIDTAKFRVDLSGQPNGVYLFMVSSNNQQSVRKIVILK
jgi:hypothetical protein